MVSMIEPLRYCSRICGTEREMSACVIVFAERISFGF
jgi:hypothetical protein